MIRPWIKRIAAASARAVVAASIASAFPASAQPPGTVSVPAALDTVRAYLRATHARDWAAVYRLLSSADRRVRDEATFLRSQEKFDGFALDLSRKLAAEMEVWLIEQKTERNETLIDVGYRVPTGDEISSRLYGWNRQKLNSLSPEAQKALLVAWEKVKQGRPVFMEGREAFSLVREKDGWKIFLDWRSHHRVLFKTSKSQPAELAVEFLRNDLLVKNDQPFQIDFKLTNRTRRELVVRLNHVFEPSGWEKHIDMIACGSLLPLYLHPLETQEISSVYLLRGAPVKINPVTIVYDFRPLERKLSVP